MLRIGLTGGIGSGKSTVARIFSVLGIPVYDSDAASKRLMNQNEELKKRIVHHFGEASYNGGLLNRKYLSDQVFGDPEKIALLNTIVHPATISDADLWMKAQKGPYLIKETALLFESGSDKYVDRVIGVRSPLILRIERAMSRSGLSEQQVRDRMALQMDEESKLGMCDYIITNDEQQLLIPQVLSLHEKFLKEAV